MLFHNLLQSDLSNSCKRCRKRPVRLRTCNEWQDCALKINRYERGELQT